MLTVPLLPRRISRIVATQWPNARQLSHRPIRPQSSKPNDNTTHRRSRAQSNGGKEKGVEKVEQPSSLSLAEQLFPEETRRYEAVQRKNQGPREIPRLPLNSNPTPTQLPSRKAPTAKAKRELWPGQQMEQEMRTDGPRPTLLVLRNASRNLVEEDFRRLIPQGKHVEGWTLEKGDILKVIPGRNLATLEQQTYYYLLFSSQLSAFTYQGHATRISQLAASQRPADVTSPMPPPPGYMADGLDVHSAIESFALIPASQKLDLRQLKPPLTPLLASIIQYQGYPMVVNRPGKLPYELRLTLEGPQLQIPTLNHIFVTSAKARGSPWSGGEEQAPRLTKWDPMRNAASRNEPSQPSLAREDRTEEDQMEREVASLGRSTETPDWDATETEDDHRRRTPKSVFIVGFHTENASLSFRRFWHRKPVEWQGVANRFGDGDDLAPIANLETLW